jgi:hypothetical protein
VRTIRRLSPILMTHFVQIVAMAVVVTCVYFNLWDGSLQLLIGSNFFPLIQATTNLSIVIGIVL